MASHFSRCMEQVLGLGKVHLVKQPWLSVMYVRGLELEIKVRAILQCLHADKRRPSEHQSMNIAAAGTLNSY